MKFSSEESADESQQVLLRITVRFVFLFYGMGKLVMGRATVAASIAQQFDKTFLPRALVTLIGNALPFLEVILGVCVLLGLFTASTLGLTTALMVTLILGQVIAYDTGVVANNLIYSIILFLLLFFARHKAFCVDQFRTKQNRMTAE